MSGLRICSIFIELTTAEGYIAEWLQSSLNEIEHLLENETYPDIGEFEVIDLHMEVTLGKCDHHLAHIIVSIASKQY